jgi:hypothetical protein
MTAKRRQDADSVASEVRVDEEKELSTSEAEVGTIALDEYLKVEKVNPGLVTSFRVEALDQPEMLEPKTSEGWAKAFIDQTNRVYE